MTLPYRNVTTNNVPRDRHQFQRSLILASAYFLPWGDGLQRVSSIDLSKIFVTLAALVIASWLWAGQRVLTRVPVAFRLFLVFAACHSVLVLMATGGPMVEWFGMASSQEIRGGFSRAFYSQGLTIARFFFLIAYGCAVASIVNSRQLIAHIGVALALGLGTVMLLGGFAEVTSGNALLHGYGFLNSNAFGRTAAIGFFLMAYAFTGASDRWRRVATAATWALCAFGVLTAGSRGAVVATVVGAGVWLALAPGVRRRAIAGTLALTLVVAVGLSMPQRSRLTLLQRFSSAIADQGSGRIGTWRAYLSEIGDYLLFGTGIGRVDVPVEGLRGTHDSPHNTYLSQLIQFGLVGACLFVASLVAVASRLWRAVRREPSLAAASLAGLFAAVLTNFSLMDSLGDRDVCLAMGILFAVGHQGFESDATFVPFRRTVGQRVTGSPRTDRPVEV